MIKKWEIAPEAKRKRCIDEVLTRIDEQGEAEFGILAAEELIDIISQHVGPTAYNQGIDDVKKLLTAKLADTEVDIELLKVQD